MTGNLWASVRSALIEPTLRGWPLYWAAMMGATPALAPGAMLRLGLIGMLWAWRHPVLQAATTREIGKYVDANEVARFESYLRPIE